MEASVSAMKDTEIRLAGKDRELYLRFLNASYEERKRLRKEGAVIKRWHERDEGYYLKELTKFSDKIKKDPELAGTYKYNWSEPEVTTQCNRVIAQRAFKSRHDDLYNYERNKESDTEKKIEQLRIRVKKYSEPYVPSAERIRITKNITFNEKDVIPVYSELPNETLENLSINDFFVYEYGDINLVDKTRSVNLVKAIELAKEEDNMIKCTCTDGRCYENKKCPCSQVNHKLRGFQQTVPGQKRTAFTSFEPILLSQSSNALYDCVGFACSELCGCNGRCNNNSLLLTEKSVFPLEVYRSNPNIGFCIRCPVPIPAGTPFTTFVGDLLEETHFNMTHQDYSYEVWRNDEMRMAGFIETETKFTEEYKTLLKDLFRHSFQVDPTTYGNVGRTAGHSCVPNCELLRVYKKSFSPAHINLVMIALVDIIPGTPITIDYGKLYAERLKDVCACGTFYCQNGKEAAKFNSMGYPDLSVCLQHIHNEKVKIYTKNLGLAQEKPEKVQPPAAKRRRQR